MADRDMQPERTSPSAGRTSWTVLDDAPVAAIALSLDSHIVYQNAAAQALLGYDTARMIDAPMSMAFLTASWFLSQPDRLGLHRVWSGRVSMCRSDGEVLPVAMNAFVGPTPAGDECLITLIHPAIPRRAGSESATPLDTNAFGLSVPEVEALMLWAEGLSDEDTAILLGISVQEVVGHLKAGCQKMGTGSRTAACIRALKAGFII